MEALHSQPLEHQWALVQDAEYAEQSQQANDSDQHQPEEGSSPMCWCDQVRSEGWSLALKVEGDERLLVERH